MAFLAGGNENQQLQDLPEGDFGRVHERFLLPVRTNSITDREFCLLEIRPIVCFCRNSTYVFILSAPTLFTSFIRCRSFSFHSFIKSTFLVI